MPNAVFCRYQVSSLARRRPLPALACVRLFVCLFVCLFVRLFVCARSFVEVLAGEKTRAGQTACPSKVIL